MPEFWQFPTGSMGLGPINAIYQARFMRYLEHRGILETEGRKIWAFVATARWTSPNRSPACRSPRAEGLDNLIFVVNCNLQRLDGPVRGNGSIVQELEGLFAGAGWNVLKLLWGSDWDALFARDHDGVLLKRLHETVDGEFPDVRGDRRALNREHFFNKYPELTELISGMSDGRYRPPAPRRAMTRSRSTPLSRRARAQGAAHRDPRPDQEGLRHGALGPGQDGQHQQKKLDDDGAARVRDRFLGAAFGRTTWLSLRFLNPGADSQEMKYLHARRRGSAATLPVRRVAAQSSPCLH